MLGSKQTNTWPLSRWIKTIHRDLQEDQNKRACHLMTGVGTTGINRSKAKSGRSERNRISRVLGSWSWECGRQSPGCGRDAQMFEVNEHLKSSTATAGVTFFRGVDRNPQKRKMQGQNFSPLKAVHPVRKLRSQKHVSAPKQGASQFLHPWLNEKGNGWMVYSFPFHHQSKAYRNTPGRKHSHS